MNNVDSEIGNVSGFVKENLITKNGFLILISPYIKLSALSEIITSQNQTLNKFILITRWLPEDLLTGVSDVETYDFVKEHGGEMYLNHRLHAKIYVSDYRTALIGSANLTNKGLGFSENHNIEAIVKVECNESLLSEINSLIDNSTKLNDDIAEDYKDFVCNYKKQFQPQLPEGARESFAQIKIKMEESKRGGLFVHDFLFDPILFVHPDSAKKSFLSSPAYSWQKENIKKPTSFGKYSELLHSALSDVPTPYRKQVKDLVANMYALTKAYSDEFYFETPNYSEIIKPKE